MVNVISLDEALLRNRAWVNPEPEDQRWGRRAPPASQKHVLENLFDPQLFERNLKEVFSRWTRLEAESVFYDGTKVYVFDKPFAGLHEITYVSDKPTLVHPCNLIEEGIGVSWWVIKNGHACPYHHVYYSQSKCEAFL